MTTLLKLLSYVGLMTLAAVFVYGFRYDTDAPTINYAINLALFAGWFFIHFIMMQPWFKKLTTGNPEGGNGQRQLYVTVAIVTWLALYVVHLPLPGPALELPAWVEFLGVCLVFLGFFSAMELADFDGIDSIIGAPGSEVTLSVSPDTELLTEGAYARVRHPAYQGTIGMFLATVLMYPNMAQLFWALTASLIIIAFIPIEEWQLRKARGADYVAYMKATPYRIIPGIW